MRKRISWVADPDVIQFPKHKSIDQLCLVLETNADNNK